MLLHSHIENGFQIFGIEISFYGIIIALAITFAIFVATKIAKKRNFTKDDIFTLALYVIPFSIIGARLYFVIFSGYNYTFWQIFEIWNGGMAILGGVIGGTLAIVLYSIIHKKNFLALADIAAPSLIIGLAIGRIGCYFAGCCYGIETVDPALQLFPISEQINGVWHLSTMFYESFWCFLCFPFLLWIFNKSKSVGIATFSYMIMYGFGRFFIEIFRGESLYLFDTGIKVSQALSAVIFLVGIIGIVAIYLLPKIKKQR